MILSGACFSRRAATCDGTLCTGEIEGVWPSRHANLCLFSAIFLEPKGIRVSSQVKIQILVTVERKGTEEMSPGIVSAVTKLQSI